MDSPHDFPRAAPAEAISTVASAQPMADGRRLLGFLISYDVDPSGIYYPLRAGTQRVGRKGASPGLDVAIDHPTVSSNHALIYLDPGKQLSQIEDTQSANGTLLNDAPIADQGRRELRDGDRLRFGALNAVIKLVERH